MLLKALIIVHLLYQKACRILAVIVALPFVILGLVSDKIKGEISQPSLIISRIPFYIGERARWYYYKALLLSLGSDVRFAYGSFCQYRRAKIGSRVLIGYFDTIGEVSIGDNVLIGGNVNLLSGLHQHAFNDPDKLIWDNAANGRTMIKIGSDVWIGSNSIIGCDVGDRCVVSAGSVVINYVASHSLVGGNPAKLIRKI